MDTYADDLNELFTALDLKGVTMIGDSTGGGEVARYIGRHGTKRVARAVLMGAVPPIMLKTMAHLRVADGGVRRFPQRLFRPTARSSSWTSPKAFFGFNRPGAKVPRG